MQVDIGIIEQLLLARPVPFERIEGEFMRRIWDVYRKLEEKNGSKMDLAVLIRQALRFLDSQPNASQGNSIIKCCKSEILPSRIEWELCNLQIFKEDNQYFFLQAKPWQPIWLEGSSETVPEKDAFAQSTRRRNVALMADPFLLKNTSFTHYHNIAQRDAIRAIVTMPSGSTLAISLPTGSGKSLCATLPAILEQGLTVVVVPTIALALDQEQALQSLIPYPMAYCGGNELNAQKKRIEIIERIRNKEQKIIFTSPESVTGSLYKVLLFAANEGYLSYLVIDEAHTVYGWGNDFRPSFQKLAGVRRVLFRRNKNLKTILLSATFTSTSLKLLNSLFSEPGPFKVYASMQVRPEPSFWFNKCEEDEKESRLLEAIHNLPRPLIIYTSRVADTQKWYNVIKSAGYKRIGNMTGSSTSEERVTVITNWKKGDLDIVVGTSSFGLGIDKDNVRAVIHACIPESVDRYYQEVGRGGRDGKASISLVLYTVQDEKDAKGLSTNKLISLKKGWLRWHRLFSANTHIDGRRYNISLEERPHIDIEPGDYNEAWNLKTLLLMAQAGLIALDGEDLNVQRVLPKENSSQELDKPEYDNIQTQVIEVLDLSHNDEAYWKEKVKNVRKTIKMEGKQGLLTILKLLEGTECVGKILQGFYENNDVKVVSACGGCPCCRKDKRNVRYGLLPQTAFSWQYYDFRVIGDLEEEFRNTNHLYIFFKQDDLTNKNGEYHLSKLYKWFFQRGIVAYCGKNNVLNNVQLSLAGFKSPVLLYTLDEAYFIPTLPTIYIWLDEHDPVPLEIIKSRGSNHRIILLPYESKQPEAPTRFLRDMVSAPNRTILFKDFLNKHGIV